MDAIKYRQALILVPAFCIGGYMNKFEAVELALYISNMCSTYDGDCISCPFNIRGCIVSTGNADIPQLWEVNDLINAGISKRKEKDGWD